MHITEQSFHLSIEQQFELQRLQCEYAGLTDDEIKTALLETMHLLMVRDNEIRVAMRRSLL